MKSKNIKTATLSIAAIGIFALSTTTQAQSFNRGSQSVDRGFQSSNRGFQNVDRGRSFGVNQEIAMLDRLSDQMLRSNQLQHQNTRYRSQKSSSNAVFSKQLKRYNSQVDLLVRASKGNSFHTYKKALADTCDCFNDLKTSFRSLNHRNPNQQTAILIKQSSNYTSNLSSNVNRWRPVNVAKPVYNSPKKPTYNSPKKPSFNIFGIKVALR